VDNHWVKLGLILQENDNESVKIKKELREMVIPSLRTLEHTVNILTWKDTSKKPLVTTLGAQEMVFRRLSSITENSQNTLLLDTDKENSKGNGMKIDIQGKDFRFGKVQDGSLLSEGKMYVYNQNYLAGISPVDGFELVYKRKVLISILRFRDSLELLQGTVDVRDLLRAKSLNFKCKDFTWKLWVIILR
jgi:hypothetical protein